VVNEASIHVKAAIEMRQYANRKMAQAAADDSNDVPWGERHDCFIADFCQNMECPYFGASQPGDTYYMSPRSVFCFGVSNTGRKDHFLNAYIYLEGEAKKGGNNVASLLMKHLKDEGFIDHAQGPRKELSFIMDNCGGQNKNRMVLRLALLLVELGWYKEVNFSFLIAGHTKNSCDRLFNILKLKYRESDVFSIDGKGGLIQLLNECKLVHAVSVKE